MNDYLPYCGVGSRETPDNVLEQMVIVGQVLDRCGFTLRSGGASGADTAFEKTVRTSNREIFIPWNGFNGRNINEPGVYADWPNKELEQTAFAMASEIHPNWAACSNGAKRLHARNMAQVLGRNLDSPSLFVVCWTPNGNGGGGTGQALRAADKLNIPVFDLGKGVRETLDSLSNHIAKTFYKGN